MSWTSMDKGYPGAFFNFVQVAAEMLEGSEGTVAVIQSKYNATATADTLYTFTSRAEAREIVGVSNLATIESVFKGGASKVLVYTVAKPALESDPLNYTKAQTALDLQFFEGVTFDHPLDAAAITSWKTWAEDKIEQEDKYHAVFFGSDEDTADGALATSTANKSDVLYNVGNAPAGMASYQFAPLVAGYAASVPLSQSLTFKTVEDATDVNVRYSTAQKKAALANGVGVIFAEFNGRKVRIVRGVSTNGTSLQTFSLKQALTREWKFMFEEKYAGKVQNGVNERLSAERDFKNFLQLWADRGLIEEDTWNVRLTAGPAKNQVVLDSYMVNQETMEELYGTITLG